MYQKRPDANLSIKFVLYGTCYMVTSHFLIERDFRLIIAFVTKVGKRTKTYIIAAFDFFPKSAN